MLKHWIWLSEALVPSGKASDRIFDYYPSAEEVFGASREELSEIEGITKGELDALSTKKLNKADKIERVCAEKGIRIMSMADKGYPKQLRSIFAPPPVLYWKGILPDFDKVPMFTIVGTRKATRDGERAAYEFACKLSQMGCVIVSGMAYGADTKANEGCIEGGSPTIAVLGCGVDIVYPPTNLFLMNEITQKGAIISEFAPGVGPLAHNFPARNRIMAGLGLGVLIVEAPVKSGAVITADLASDMGKEVFVIPGGIYNSNYAGSNNLIKNGSTPVTCVEDIVERLPVHFEMKYTPEEVAVSNKLDSISSPVERKIAEILMYHRELYVDEIIKKSGFSEDLVLPALMMLEINNIIKNTGGSIYAIYE